MEESPYHKLSQLTEKLSQSIEMLQGLHSQFRDGQREVYKTGSSIHQMAAQLKEGQLVDTVEKLDSKNGWSM